MPERKITVSPQRTQAPSLHESKRRETIAKGAFRAYDFCNKTLRAWLATYSVGVPAFLFTRDATIHKLAARHETYRVALLFALAIGLQVVLTFFNKYTQWGVYAKYGEPADDNWLTRWCETASEWIFLDFLLDALTMLLLAFASYLAFTALVGA